jgi:hypothetical protein
MSVRKTSTGILLAFAACLLVTASLARAKTDHKDYKDAKPEECRACHESSGVPENHGASFVRNHRTLAQRSSNNCEDCHAQSYCVDCHNGGNVDADQRSLSRRGESLPTTHAADFISTHPLKAADDPESCYRCHTPQSCSDCHTQQTRQNRAGGRSAMSIKPHSPTFVSGGVPDPSWVSFHRSEARKNLRSCQGCHPQKSDCSNSSCHPGLQGR